MWRRNRMRCMACTIDLRGSVLWDASAFEDARKGLRVQKKVRQPSSRTTRHNKKDETVPKLFPISPCDRKRRCTETGWYGGAGAGQMSLHGGGRSPVGS